MEDEVLGLARDLAGQDRRLTGRLRVTCSETLAYQLLTSGPPAHGPGAGVPRCGGPRGREGPGADRGSIPATSKPGRTRAPQHGPRSTGSSQPTRPASNCKASNLQSMADKTAVGWRLQCRAVGPGLIRPVLPPPGKPTGMWPVMAGAVGGRPGRATWSAHGARRAPCAAVHHGAAGPCGGRMPPRPGGGSHRCVSRPRPAAAGDWGCRHIHVASPLLYAGPDPCVPV